MQRSTWSAEEIPDLSGKIAVVTGANSGIGYHTARQLARHGARVVMACRSEERGGEALRDIEGEFPGAALELRQLDLADLSSVEAFAEAFCADFDRLDILCNNAGVMALPRTETADGFEMQFGTNHLGHFALTARLIEPIRQTDGARVVTVTSAAHKIGKIRFDDPHYETGEYGRWKAYGQSKLANLVFAYELQRRFEKAGVAATSHASHPGYTSTQLQFKAARQEGLDFVEKLARLGNRLFAQEGAMGALPSLYAATKPGLEGGEFIGPGGFLEAWGPPVEVEPEPRRCQTHS